MSIVRIIAIVIIYVIASLGWSVLGTATALRSDQSTSRLGPQVEDLVGAPLRQEAPQIAFVDDSGAVVSDGAVPTATVMTVDLGSDPRQRGLIWYPTFTCQLAAAWTISNPHDRTLWASVRVKLPDPDGTYDAFAFAVDGSQRNLNGDPRKGLVAEIPLQPGAEAVVQLNYQTRGMASWSYQPGHDRGRIRNLDLTVNTDFTGFDYLEGSSAAMRTTRSGDGHALSWVTNDLITSKAVGISLPEPVNPGPITTRMTFFAPVCLGFFFLLVAAVTIICRIPIHPMHYLFVAAGFFAFHLLLAYLVDHLPLHMSFALAGAVSLGLTTSYLRGALGRAFPTTVALGGQLFFLILFSYSFFFQGFTGLSVAIGSVVTLAVLMRLTVGVDWFQVFRKPARKGGATVEGEAFS